MTKTLATIFATAIALALVSACGTDPCDAGACTFSGGTWEEPCPIGSGCSVTATDGANVHFSCAGGSCGMSCDGAAGCVLDCPGGSCSLNCGTTPTCQITSCGTACALSCGGAASCSNSCDILGGCTTSP